jgi:hypothetical protein
MAKHLRMNSRANVSKYDLIAVIKHEQFLRTINFEKNALSGLGIFAIQHYSAHEK